MRIQKCCVCNKMIDADHDVFVRIEGQKMCGKCMDFFNKKIKEVKNNEAEARSLH